MGSVYFSIVFMHDVQTISGGWGLFVTMKNIGFLEDKISELFIFILLVYIANRQKNLRSKPKPCLVHTLRFLLEKYFFIYIFSQIVEEVPENYPFSGLFSVRKTHEHSKHDHV